MPKLSRAGLRAEAPLKSYRWPCCSRNSSSCSFSFPGGSLSNWQRRAAIATGTRRADVYPFATALQRWARTEKFWRGLLVYTNKSTEHRTASKARSSSSRGHASSTWCATSAAGCRLHAHPRTRRSHSTTTPSANTVHNHSDIHSHRAPQFATPKALFGAAASLTRGAADLGREATGAAVAHAKKSMSNAIETATLEYDDAGNAFVRMEAEGADDASSQHLDGSTPAESQEHGGGDAAGVPASPLVRAQLGHPATPGSALSDPDVSAQLARLLEEREDMRGRVEEQKGQIDQRLAEHLQTASQREQHFAQQLRAATDREQARVGPHSNRWRAPVQPTLLCSPGAGVGATCAAGRGAHAGRARGGAARRARAAAAPQRADNLSGGVRSRKRPRAPCHPDRRVLSRLAGDGGAAECRARAACHRARRCGRAR